MKNETAKNGAGITEVGFPMWPQFAPETLNDVLSNSISGCLDLKSS